MKIIFIVVLIMAYQIEVFAKNSSFCSKEQVKQSTISAQKIQETLPSMIGKLKKIPKKGQAFTSVGLQNYSGTIVSAKYALEPNSNNYLNVIIQSGNINNFIEEFKTTYNSFLNAGPSILKVLEAKATEYKGFPVVELKKAKTLITLVDCRFHITIRANGDSNSFDKVQQTLKLIGA